MNRQFLKIAVVLSTGLIGFASGLTLVSGQVAPLTLSLSSIIGVSDTEIAAPPLVLSLASTVGVSDGPAVAPPLGLSLASTIGVSDALGVHPPLALDLVSQIQIADDLIVAVDRGPETVTVNITDDVDDGTCDQTHCSMREAIEYTNGNHSAFLGYTDTIGFDIPGPGPHVIQPTSELPAITDPVVIDGTTEPDFKGYPVVEINGSLAGDVSGLTLAGSGSTIRSLAITNFAANGIVVSDGDRNTISQNSIRRNGGLPIDIGSDGQDTNDTGDSDSGPNGGQNFPVITSADVTLAGTTIEGALNSSANETFHIELFASVGTNDADVLFHTLDVTTDASGDAPISIVLDKKFPAGESITATATDSNGNTSEVSTFVKATGLYTVNTIADSRTFVIECDPTNCAFGDALELANVDGRDSVITFNIPGTAPHVVEVELVSGLPVAETPVVIDGTTQPGYGGSPVIELDWQGPGGLFVHGGSTTIRGLAIRANTNPVLSLQFEGNNVIQGNYLGTDVTGTVDHGSSDYGIRIDNGSTNNLIGGPEPGQGNLFKFNNDGGVRISSSSATNNRIQGNEFVSNTGPSIEYSISQGVVVPPIPTLTSAIVGSAIFEGTLTGEPNTMYTIEFFSSDSCDVQGGTPVGSIDVTTDGSGIVDFTASFDTTVPAGHFIAATATGPNGTSQFSECVEAVTAPPATAVNTTDDAFNGGCTVIHCSLRERIFEVNLSQSEDTVTFNIPETDFNFDPATGVFTTYLLSPLPSIDIGHTIDGYSQPGASPNTDPDGNNAVLKIELDGSLLDAPAGERIGINLFRNGSTVKGLIINNFVDAGVLVEGGPDIVVEGNWIGVRGDGETAPGNGYGVDMVQSFNNRIGGPNPESRNVISGPVLTGLALVGAHIRIKGDPQQSSGNNVIKGNFIGTNAAGTAVVDNGPSRGIFIRDSENNVIVDAIGQDASAPNVIAGHTWGIDIAGDDATGTSIHGNRIGTDLTGTLDLGNGVGIKIDANGTRVGLGQTGGGNDIAFNTLGGVVISDGTGNQIRGNRIWANGDLGINLDNDGVTPNDDQDADGGPNGLQNFPVLTDINARAGILTGTLNSTPSTEFIIEIFSNDSCDPSGHGEGQEYIGSVLSVLTDESGNAEFTESSLDRTRLRQFLTATATDPNGNTSEFSACLSVPDQTIIVDSGTDAVDADPGDGYCDDGAGNCTLRAAIIEANALPGADTIVLPEGTYLLTIEGSGEGGSFSGDLNINSNVTILGAGSGKTIIDGNKGTASDPDRVFHVSDDGSLAMSDVTIQNGSANDGGGLYNDRGVVTLERVVVASNSGDGLYNGSFSGANATMTITDSTILNNTGDAIQLSGSHCCSPGSGNSTVTLLRSTVRNNSNGIALGHQHAFVRAYVINSTLANNGADAIENNPSNSGFSRVYISHSTIVGHSRGLTTGSPSDGGNDRITVKNSILAGNGTNCSGSEAGPHELLSEGYNISDDASCAMFDESGDVNETDPLLGALADHGGITESFSLLPGSPAIDKVPLDLLNPEDNFCTDPFGETLTDDQRGFARPFDAQLNGVNLASCDIGSFEFGGGSEPGGPVVVGSGNGIVTPAEGGTIDAGEGDAVSTSINVPPTAVSANLEIGIQSFQSDDTALPPLPDGTQGTGVLGRVFTFSPAGTQFDAPLTLTISYTQEHLDETGLIEGSVYPLLLVNGEWVVVGDCESQGPPNPDPCLVERDTNANVLTIETTHFSTYALAGAVLTDTLTVNSTVDSVDASPGDGLCADANGECTLRAAIMEANTNVNVSNVDVPAGSFLLTIPGSGENESARGDLDITSEMTIVGAGSDQTIIDGNDGVVNDHVINVRTGASLTMSNVWIDNGDQDGIRNEGGTLVLDYVVVSGHDEDGIENVQSGGNAILTVRNSTIRNNNIGIQVVSGAGFSGATIIGSTIRHNSTYGIYVGNSNSTSEANVINSTIYRNFSNAIRIAPSNSQASRVYLSNVTVANNSSGLRTGGPSDGGTSQFRIKNTILSNNGSDNCSGGDSGNHTITSLGNNISSDAGCPMFTEPGDLQQTDPLLGPLQDNGGPTLTHALLAASPAIDAVPFLDCSDTGGNPVKIDQRGHDRQTGLGCDVGAFEFGADFKLPDVPTTTPVAMVLLALLLLTVSMVVTRRRRV